MNYTLEFLRFLVGRRTAITTDTQTELDYLAKLARNASSIVEVGVFEGLASAYMCQTMSPAGKLYLVDPYFPTVRLEKLLHTSFSRLVAQRTLRKWRRQIQFVRDTSTSSAGSLRLQQPADLIFIDARHDYDSVLEDFQVWQPHLAQHGQIAFHDSQPCSARPDLDETVGPVRLLAEIAAGKHGVWQVVAMVDSLSVIEKVTL